MNTNRHPLEITFLIIISSLFGIFLAFNLNKNKPQLNLSTNFPVMAEQSTNLVPTEMIAPTETPAPKITIVSQISSDASVKVELKSTILNDKTQNVTLTTTDSKDENTHVIFTKTLAENQNIILPFNAWSPDNKYFFITQNNPEGAVVSVYKASGDPFSDGKQSLDLTGVFKDHAPNYNFKEATGWASETLIIINTTTQNHEVGPSYWFEVPSEAVIQLSSVF